MHKFTAILGSLILVVQVPGCVSKGDTVINGKEKASTDGSEHADAGARSARSTESDGTKSDGTNPSSDKPGSTADEAPSDESSDTDASSPSSTPATSENPTGTDGSPTDHSSLADASAGNESTTPTPTPSGAECDVDADCDDGIACTVDSCSSAKKCEYELDDSVCEGGYCLGLASSDAPGSGCCVDADGDGHPSAACGGDDCFDDAAESDEYGTLLPEQVYPGASGERCDGIDKNCSGENKPRRTADEMSSPLTTGTGDKSQLAVAVALGNDGTAQSYLLLWQAETTDGPVFEYALTDGDGVVDGKVGIQSLDLQNATLAGVVYSEEREEYAVAWTSCASMHDRGNIAWISTADGSAGQIDEQIDVGPLHDTCIDNRPSPAWFRRTSEGPARYTLAQIGGGFCGTDNFDDGAGTPLLISEDGSATAAEASPEFGCNGGTSVNPLTWIDRRDRFTALYYTFNTAGGVGQCFAWGNFTWQPDASASTTWWGPSEDGPGCAAPSTAPYGWYESGDALEPVTYYDGRAIVSVIPTSEHTGLLYQRLDPIDLGPLDSATEDTSQPGTLISDAAMQPRVVVGDAKDSVVAVFGTEPSEADQRSVYALLRNQADGSEATSMGMIARGTDVSNVNALWDGRAFRAFYLSKVDGSHQVYTAPLQCE